MDYEKYLLSEAPNFWMKEFQKIYRLKVKKNGHIWAINKKNKSDKMAFKSDKELNDFVDNWRPPKGGTQSSQF